jgi:sensor histidine kinase YesM
MTKQGLTSFEEELDHARAYLAVVKVRYEDLLFVEYDTEFTSFNLPPLTLEPIVENSVKHGLDPESSPLHIFINTKKLDRKVVLTVEDTGTGVDLEAAASKMATEKGEDAHIGLENVKARLEKMCHGTLEISPRDKGGTIVTITVPLTLIK